MVFCQGSFWNYFYTLEDPFFIREPRVRDLEGKSHLFVTEAVSVARRSPTLIYILKHFYFLINISELKIPSGGRPKKYSWVDFFVDRIVGQERYWKPTE